MDPYPPFSYSRPMGDVRDLAVDRFVRDFHAAADAARAAFDRGDEATAQETLRRACLKLDVVARDMEAHSPDPFWRTVGEVVRRLARELRELPEGSSSNDDDRPSGTRLTHVEESRE